jgi:hypothetical protein
MPQGKAGQTPRGDVGVFEVLSVDSVCGTCTFLWAGCSSRNNSPRSWVPINCEVTLVRACRLLRPGRPERGRQPSRRLATWAEAVIRCQWARPARSPMLSNLAAAWVRRHSGEASDRGRALQQHTLLGLRRLSDNEVGKLGLYSRGRDPSYVRRTMWRASSAHGLPSSSSGSQ